ncbi:hypothetical protein DXB18_12035 [Clostridium sp. OM02-18AC]|nr:hypothetical protein DXB18_12035 [Clostridium sp. OM02-18AC]
MLSAAQGDGLSLSAGRVGDISGDFAFQHIQDAVVLVDHFHPARGTSNTDYHRGSADIEHFILISSHVRRKLITIRFPDSYKFSIFAGFVLYPCFFIYLTIYYQKLPVIRYFLNNANLAISA